MMDFSAGAGANPEAGLIPNGQLAWAIINVRGLKASQKGGQYIDVELTLDDGQPYARRKLWEMIGDPQHPGNSEAYRQMGTVAICRILEAARGAGPNNQAAYRINAFTDLNGLRVPVKIKVEKGTGGYDDKNKVAEWLTPNPESKTGFADYQLLVSGVHNKTAAAPAPSAPQGGFGSPQQTQPSQPQAFGAQPGFQQPQPQGANSAAAMSQTATSPSSGGGWLQQANGG